jgi:hypothetical protein
MQASADNSHAGLQPDNGAQNKVIHTNDCKENLSIIDHMDSECCLKGGGGFSTKIQLASSFHFFLIFLYILHIFSIILNF